MVQLKVPAKQRVALQVPRADVAPDDEDFDWEEYYSMVPPPDAFRKKRAAAIAREQAERSGVTIATGGTLTEGSVQTPIEETLYPHLPGPFRAAIAGAAQVGAAIENPILRITGRGEEADKNRRALEALRGYNSQLAEDSVLGPTLGPIVNSVQESVAAGTLTGPAGLTGISAMFGIDGADRFVTEGKDAGLSPTEIRNGAARAFLVDGVLTYVGGKYAQKLGLNPGLSLGSVAGREAMRAATRSGFKHVLGSALYDAGTETVQGGLSYLNDVYSGTKEFNWDDFKKVLATSAAAGGLAGGSLATVEQSGKALTAARKQFDQKLKQSIDTVQSANDFHATATPKQIDAALKADTPRKFERATKQKNSTTFKREVFQDELKALADLELEINKRGGEFERSVTVMQEALNARKAKAAEYHTELAGIEKSLKQTGDEAVALPEGYGEKKVQVDTLRRQLQAEQKAIVDAETKLNARRAATENELAGQRQYLESTLDELVKGETTHTAQDHAGTEATPDTAPAEQAATPEPAPAVPLPAKLAKRARTLESARTTLSALETGPAKQSGTFAPAELTSAIKVAQQVVPQAKQPALFNQLRTAKTPTQKQKALTRLNEAVSKADHKLATNELRAAMVQASNLLPEFQRTVDDLKQQINFRTPRDRAGLDTLLKLHNENPAVTLSDADVALLDRAKRVPVSDFTAEEVRQLADTINSAAVQSANADSMLSERLQGKIADWTNRVVQDAEPVRPLAMKSRDPLRKWLGMNKPGVNTQRDLLSLDSPALREMNTTPEATMRRLSDTLADVVYEGIAIEGRGQYHRYMNETQAGLAAVFEQLGIPSSDALEHSLPGNPDTLSQWRDARRNLRGTEMSRDEAAMQALMYMDPDNAAVLREKGFHFPNDNRSTGPWDDAYIAELYDFIGPEGQAMNRWMYDQLQTVVIDRANASVEQLTGRPLTRKKNVVPRRVWNEETAEPTSILGYMQDPTLLGYGSLKRRKGATNPLTVPSGTSGAIDFFMNHVDRMSKVAAYAVPTRDAMAVLTTPEVKAAIMAKDGETGYQYLLDSVRQEVAPRPVTGAINRFMRSLNNKVAGGILGLRYSTMTIQPTSTLISAGWRKGGMDSLAKSLPVLFDNKLSKQWQAEMQQYSPDYVSRYSPRNFMRNTTGGIVGESGWFRPPQMSQHAMRPLQEIERVVNSTLRWGQAREYAQSLGLEVDSPAFFRETAKEWSRLTNRGENTGGGLDQTMALQYARNHPAAAPLVMFMSTVSKLASTAQRGLDLMDRGRIGEGAAALSAAAASVYLVAMIRQLTSFENVDDDFVKGAGKRALADIAGTPAVVGQFTQALARPLLGMKVYGSDSNVAADQVKRTTIALTAIADKLQGDIESHTSPKQRANQMRQGAVALSTLFGLPGAGVSDLIRRAEKGTLFPGFKEETEEYVDFAATLDKLEGNQ